MHALDHAYGRDMVEAQLAQHLQRAVELADPAINQNQVGHLGPGLILLLDFGFWISSKTSSPSCAATSLYCSRSSPSCLLVSWSPFGLSPGSCTPKANS